ncbi:hypothetical protein [Lysinibacillus xylanilyticus]|uniref:hypothetical protein n=1 Tax=Lysinibacillus xylanilyticus TaxID=582475 RepID=UPI003CFCD61F
MKFSNYFNLKYLSQENLEFIDIRVDWDNELFIDPTRIEAEKDIVSVECDKVVLDFFNTVLDLYAVDKINDARNNLVYSGESNEIFLGYTEGFPQGTGNSEEVLDDIFKYIHTQELISKGLIGRIEDLQVFIDKFGCDKMSDLIASLIKHKLIEFTVNQCNKLNIKRDYQITRRYWNRFKHSWDVVSEFVPSVIGPGGSDYPVILVPKKYVVAKYLYDDKKYWEKIVSLRRQDYHISERTSLYINKANSRGKLNKKDIWEYESNGRTLKEYLIDYTLDDLEAIGEFREDIQNTQRSNVNNSLADYEIEIIINDSIESNPSIDYEQLNIEKLDVL